MSMTMTMSMSMNMVMSMVMLMPYGEESDSVSLSVSQTLSLTHCHWHWLRLGLTVWVWDWVWVDSHSISDFQNSITLTFFFKASHSFWIACNDRVLRNLTSGGILFYAKDILLYNCLHHDQCCKSGCLTSDFSLHAKTGCYFRCKHNICAAQKN